MQGVQQIQPLSHSPWEQSQEAPEKWAPVLFFLFFLFVFFNLKREKNNEKTNPRKSSRKIYIMVKCEGRKLQYGGKRGSCTT